MKKRLGILTFHNVPNYGAVLQAYASCRFLNNIEDVDAYIIDYRGPGNGTDFAIDSIYGTLLSTSNPFKRIGKLFFYWFNIRPYKKKLRSFYDFRNQYLHLDCKIEQMSGKYNCVFYGSDQIWNPQITKGYDEILFGRNLRSYPVKKAGLAASCGDISIIDGNPEFLEYVRDFDYLSVRENSLCKYITKHNIPCVEIMDPTFLLSKEEYIQGLELDINPQDNLLVYELQKDPRLLEFAHKIARKHNLKIIHVSGYLNFQTFHTGKSFSMGPKDFLNCLSNCRYIVTNSFHGVALSIIFRKDFNVILPMHRASRLTDFLEKLKLSNRIIESVANMDLSPISYAEQEEKMSDLITASKKYIVDIVEKGL